MNTSLGGVSGELMTGETARWIYEHSADGTARFVLGTVGSNPLVCFGINPSTAKPGALDNTVKRVEKFATRNGYDSWTMLNVYPQISTDPQGLHMEYLPELKVENERHISEMIRGRTTLLAAWGNVITKRPYLRVLLYDIVQMTAAAGCRWLSLGELTTSGNPWHPLYRSGITALTAFDMDAYLAAPITERP
ncbi:DUF1643 domain-containing protein [Microbacterium horticulturae]|uniref:DUF1643 domain-containing protein n=1 Tax=Microbacterium horticulturae TaxID=3028316 RepID=A0ABY8BWT3_9MICO|nr:DUF1643 domain-containing protein [Microbacterium sp. KACC 23027]WEG08609.1 DUF1643 domain-containing protein [Microbacterium sp. KACC 23027]